MIKIGIVGAGFSGTMAAVQLVGQSNVNSFELIIINQKHTFNKGIAYSTYSEKHLLNVKTEKMSAFPDKPNHFLDWVIQKHKYIHQDRTLIANSFLPRQLYGEYLSDVWAKALELAESKNIKVTIIESLVVDLDIYGNLILLSLNDNTKVEIDYCVIATGNHIPRNPAIKNNLIYNSKKYFQNPWQIESATNLDNAKPILIIGNGLTMVDTVLGLLEQGFKNKIYSISPHGFAILPHRSDGIIYTNLIQELPKKITLSHIIYLVQKHIKAVKELGIAAETVIDSIRPYTQQIWKNLSVREKQKFLKRLRHLWGVARHRVPLPIYDNLQKLKNEKRLDIISGKIIDAEEKENTMLVKYYNNKNALLESLQVSRIINCTGPETDLMNIEASFLKSCLLKGIIIQDELKLGVRADTETFRVLNAAGQYHSNLFTIGPNLRGELWESTAVNELREQAKKFAQVINLELMKQQGSITQKKFVTYEQ